MFVICTVLLAVPVLVHGQEEAAVSGTVTDSTGGVLPGVTVTAVHEATGKSALKRSPTELGTYLHSGVRIGTYQNHGGTQGFRRRCRRGVELLSARPPASTCRCRPTGAAETVTVTGERR